jgi:hypothetical protein
VKDTPDILRRILADKTVEVETRSRMQPLARLRTALEGLSPTRDFSAR